MGRDGSGGSHATARSLIRSDSDDRSQEVNDIPQVELTVVVQVTAFYLLRRGLHESNDDLERQRRIADVDLSIAVPIPGTPHIPRLAGKGRARRQARRGRPARFAARRAAPTAE